MKSERVKKNLVLLVGLVTLVGLASLTSCSEESSEWDPYYSWETRNAMWFDQVADSARAAISAAKTQYGEDWEEHCQWRMFKSLQRSADAMGFTTDSIVCKIVKKGEGTQQIKFTDYVHLHYRGWLMSTEYITEDNITKETKMVVFSQTYYGTFNPATAIPLAMSVSGGIEGFQTALQYMVEGDDWYVYIPQQMAYGSEPSDVIPAYSTLLFRINVVGVYENKNDIPDWK